MKLSLKMACLRTSLIRDGQVFLQNRLSGAVIDLEFKEDDTMALNLTLKGRQSQAAILTFVQV